MTKPRVRKTKSKKKSSNFTLIALIVLLAGGICYIAACDGENAVQRGFKKVWSKLDYKRFKAKAKKDTALSINDTSNIFDDDNYDPTADTSEQLIARIAENLENDSAKVKELGIKDSALLNEPSVQHLDTSFVAKKDSSTKDIKKMDSSELIALKYNLEKAKNNIEKTDTNKTVNKCKQIECKLWLRASKKDQRLYVYIDGEAVDTFKISSGSKGHDTPQFETRPDGRMFKKYTSKKYPGGNYQGLGNMPYVVFIRGGYALHGTTTGNIKKLGTRASHGCIRLHPNNAKIVFELVNNFGAENTWITVTNS
jgi:lipoprotein-anchoring transpeptidase ErfK/SrfK